MAWMNVFNDCFMHINEELQIINIKMLNEKKSISSLKLIKLLTEVY
jgi:hypothetical protein